MDQVYSFAQTHLVKLFFPNVENALISLKSTWHMPKPSLHHKSLPQIFFFSTGILASLLISSYAWYYTNPGFD